MKISFSKIGFYIGLIALIGAMFHNWLGPIEPPPKKSLIDHSVNFVDKYVLDIKSEKWIKNYSEEDSWTKDKILATTTLSLGILAFVLGLIGMINEEPKLTVRLAAIIGVAAIMFHYFAFIIFLLALSILIGVSIGLDQIVHTIVELMSQIFGYEPKKKPK